MPIFVLNIFQRSFSIHYLRI